MLFFHLWWLGLVVWCIDATRREVKLRATAINWTEMSVVFVAGIVWPVLVGLYLWEITVGRDKG